MYYSTRCDNFSLLFFDYPLKTIGFALRQATTLDLITEAIKILRWIWEQEKTIYFSDTTLLALGDLIPKDKQLRIEKNTQLDLFIFFGGDGTLLRSLHEYSPWIFKTPIVGIHGGNLGFFSSTLPSNAKKTLENIFTNNNIQKDERMILYGEMQDEQKIPEKTFYALNECTIHHAGIARLRHLSTWVDEELLTVYRADGIIVATPTGSTAYNLAAGGPIVAIDTDGIVITPLAPAGFSQRSIIVSAEKTVKITVDAQQMISIDGQEYFSFPQGYSLHLKKHSNPLIFLRQENESYFKTLREKLGWG